MGHEVEFQVGGSGITSWGFEGLIGRCNFTAQRILLLELWKCPEIRKKDVDSEERMYLPLKIFDELLVHI